MSIALPIYSINTSVTRFIIPSINRKLKLQVSLSFWHSVAIAVPKRPFDHGDFTLPIDQHHRLTLRTVHACLEAHYWCGAWIRSSFRHEFFGCFLVVCRPHAGSLRHGGFHRFSMLFVADQWDKYALLELADILDQTGVFVPWYSVANDGDSGSIFSQLAANHGESSDAFNSVVLHQFVNAIFEALLGWRSQPGGDHTTTAFSSMNRMVLIFNVGFSVVCEHG
ncbi:hypothetical protein HG531_005600 [Fusarium graminearum]|nr:hypothetical protein HG531_005600 [Fusarium graminearum]